MRKIITAALAFIILGIGAVPAAAADVIYVMRHLHKAAGDDPPLTEEGASFARLLAGQLGGSGIKAVFATATRRAAQTAEPLAQALRIPVTTYDPRDVPRLVAAVQAVRGNVLVVGHSNTVPDLVAAFGGAKPAPIADTEYGTIYIVEAGSPDVGRMHVPPPPIPAAPERGR
jgi:broad specificity phosphatase PhoE